jgi:cytoskeletal protein RodZ
MDELIEELKSKRKAQGLTIQDLFQRTRINTDFLEALEAGNFEVLPEAYIKLFLKRYAQEVKLDGDEIVRRFEQHQWKEKSSSETSHRRETEGTPGWVIGLGGAVLIGLVAVVAIWQSTPQPTSTETVRETRSLAARSTPQPAPPAPRPEPAAAVTQMTPSPEIESAAEGTTPSADSRATQSPMETAPPTPRPSDPIAPAAVENASPEPEPEADETSPPVDPPAIVAVADPETTTPSSASPADTEPAPEDATENERVVSAYSLSLKQDLSSSTGGLTLSAVGLEATEVAVTLDGEPVYSGVIDAGRRTSWEAKDRFSIEIQKGPALRLQIQDEILPVVGAEGRQVRLYISRFSIWVEEIESLEPAASTDTTP